MDRCEATFDPQHLETYKQALYEWVDVQLVKELNKVGAPELGKLYEDTQKNFIGEGLR